MKGKLRQVKPKGPTLRFQFNPTTVKDSMRPGGWREVPRPGRRTALTWDGQPLRRISFTLYFDEFDTGQSIHDRIRKLRDMSEPRAPRKPPPELEFDYGPVGRASRWVILSLDPGDELRNSNLEVIRQEFAVVLGEYTDAGVAFTPAKRHNDKKKNKPSRVHVVKQGETLTAIAADSFGQAELWREIAALNGIRDPRAVTPGQRILIPEG